MNRSIQHTRSCGLRPIVGVLLFACSISLLAGCAGRSFAPPTSPTAAVVQGRTITLEDVDEAMKDELFAQRYPASRELLLFEARRTALERIIDDEVVAAAAGGSNLDPDAWLAAEVGQRSGVSDEEIDEFWQQHEDRIPKDRTEEQVRSDIRAYLVEEHGKEIVSSLREEAKVRIVLARPRHRVEPKGTPRGPENAPITIVEFSDFQCPYCRRVNPTVRQVLEQYPEQVRIYYRHLPLPSHSRARAAAEASVCAERQGRFWDYHDLLFETSDAMMEDADLRAHAEALDLDLERFDSCLVGTFASARIDEDMAAAQAADVSGTPVFFINGVRLTGAQPFSAFESVIEEELAASN